MITLWELRGREDRRYSLFSWRSRMALRHKGLAFDTRPVCLSDKASIEFSGGKTVPVIRDENATEAVVVRDSWKIAEYLETRYPEAPPLFGGEIGRGVSQTFNSWVDRAVVPAMLRLIAADIHQRLDPSDEDYFRQTMEKVLQCRLEDTRAGREQAQGRLGKALEPVQAALKRQPYVCGKQPAYADYVLFSVFQWARIMSPQPVLGEGEPLHAWRERLLDCFGGFAREFAP